VLAVSGCHFSTCDIDAVLDFVDMYCITFFSFSVLRVRFYINKQINVYLLKLIKTVTNLQTLISVVLFVRSFILFRPMKPSQCTT